MCKIMLFQLQKTVLIKEGSLIGWHGGPRQSDELWQASVSSTDKEELMTFISRLREKRRGLFLSTLMLILISLCTVKLVRKNVN